VSNEIGVWIATIVMTIVLLWGLKIISWALMQSPKPIPLKGEGTAPAPPQPLATTILAESPDPDTGDYKGSFSRTAGAFGAMGMAAALVGISYWVIFDLYEDSNGSSLGNLKNAGWYFLAGSALFAPYAFNQLSKIFNPK
jgi:hypothetical protein